nr:hypothetical protein [Mucilaginibacter sp. SP1R1]
MLNAVKHLFDNMQIYDRSFVPQDDKYNFRKSSTMIPKLTIS